MRSVSNLSTNSPVSFTDNRLVTSGVQTHLLYMAGAEGVTAQSTRRRCLPPHRYNIVSKRRDCQRYHRKKYLSIQISGKMSIWNQGLYLLFLM